MSDERTSFEMTRARLEDIVTQARRKDVSLEQSLDLLEEAVRLVNQCNEMIDQTSFRAPASDEGAEAAEVDVVVTDVVEVLDADGDGLVETVLETVTVSVEPVVVEEDDARE